MATLTLDALFFLNKEEMFPHFKRNLSIKEVFPQFHGGKFPLYLEQEISLKNIRESRFINVLINNVSSSS
jgi:hypothetical protein